MNDGGLRAHKEAGNNEMKPKNFYGIYKDGQGGWPALMDGAFAAMVETSCQQFVNVQMLADNKRTLIACEQLGRKCYMMEIDPHYCDVILARWEKLTGREAKKLNL